MRTPLATSSPQGSTPRIVRPEVFEALRREAVNAKFTPEIRQLLRALVGDAVREEFTRQRGVASAPAASPSEVAYVSTREAAAMVAVHPATIRQWIRARTLTPYRAGRELRVSVRELHDAMARSVVAGEGAVDLDGRATAIVTSGKAKRR